MNCPVVKLLPNIFTFLRLILIPIFVLLMIKPTVFMMHVALVVFVLAAVTDFIDGKLARKYAAVTDCGKLLDPIADKILVMAALVMLASKDLAQFGIVLPNWIVVVILARETWVNGVRSLLAARGRVLAAGKAGKLKSAMQMVAIPLMLLVGVDVVWGDVVLSCQNIGFWLLVVSIIVSYYGAIKYSLLIFSTDD